MPRSRFEPERLCTGAQPAARTTSESIRAVVVLPFVPDTHTVPWLSVALSDAIASGASPSATMPGSAVAPRPIVWSAARAALPAATAAIVRRERVVTPRTLGAGRLDLAEPELEVVGPTAEPERERFGHVAVRAGVLQGPLGFEVGQQRDGTAAACDRERGRVRAAQPRDPRLDLVEPAAELVL